MSIIKYKPESMLYSVKEEMNKIFDTMLQTYPFSLMENISGKWQPRMDIVEESNGYVVSVDIPGIEAKDLKISVDNNVLIVQGEKNIETTKENKNYKHTERYTGSFYRQIALPSNIDAEKISAKVKNGVLILDIPKGTGQETKYIEVQQG